MYLQFFSNKNRSQPNIHHEDVEFPIIRNGVLLELLAKDIKINDLGEVGRDENNVMKLAPVVKIIRFGEDK